MKVGWRQAMAKHHVPERAALLAFLLLVLDAGTDLITIDVAPWTVWGIAYLVATLTSAASALFCRCGGGWTVVAGAGAVLMLIRWTFLR